MTFSRGVNQPFIRGYSRPYNGDEGGYQLNLVKVATNTTYRWATGISGPASVTEFIVSFWVKLASFTAASNYVLFDQSIYGTRFHYAYQSNTEFHMQLGDGVAAYADTRATGNAGENTSLNHHCVIFRRDGTNKIYINGADVSSVSNAWVTGETLNMSAANDFRLPSASNGSGYWPANTQFGDIFIAFSLNGKNDSELLSALWNNGVPKSLSDGGPTPGTLPTGLQPAIFFGDTQLAADWNARSNLGSLPDPGAIFGSFSDV